MSYGYGWRPHIESALCLDIADLKRAGVIAPNLHRAGQLQFGTSASMGIRVDTLDASGWLVLTYTAENEPETCRIELETIWRHYGGRDWFFRCPASGRRARKIYKWAGIPLFRHREAMRPKPTYAIQRTSAGMERAEARRWALRRKLGDPSDDLADELVKPKWMRQRTFQRYLDRDAALAEQDGIWWARMVARFLKLDPDEAEGLERECGG